MVVRELLLIRHGESQGNVAASEAHASGAHEIDVPARDPDVDLSRSDESRPRPSGSLSRAMTAESRPQALVVLALPPGP